MLKDINLNIFGINVSVKSDNECFLNMAYKNLIFFNSRSLFSNAQLFRNKNINVVFLSGEKTSGKINKNEFSQIGTNAFVSHNKYVYFYGPLRVEIVLNDTGMNILAQYCFPVNFKAHVKDFIMNSFFKSRRNYFLLIRYLVLFPVFTLLEYEKDIFLLHGSAINFKGSGVVFAGLAGVGKSLLSVSLCLDRGAKFLTDNFLLFDSRLIYPFPEFIRLSEDAFKRMRNSSGLGQPVMERFNRKYYNFSHDKISEPVPIKILFIPRISRESYMKRVTVDSAADMILLSNDHVREFQQYHLSGLLGFMFKRDNSGYKAKIDALATLLKQAAIYELGVPSVAFPADEVIGRLNDLY